MTWQSSATTTTLVKRAKFLSQIRAFFAQRGVLEVETPLLSRNTITDLHLDSFITHFHHDTSGHITPLYLQTSPEFHMKRLLAGGSGPIYQICKAFRNEAAGSNHNPEFSMLEWYRPDFDDHQLMTELDELVQCLLATQPALRISYQQAFKTYLNIDPLTITLDALKQHVAGISEDDWLQAEDNRDSLLQWLFSMVIEPKLGGAEQVPCFVFDFPASQAALAKVNKANPLVAHRFELYYQGLELANGYYELQDAEEQMRRFKADNQQRAAIGKPQQPMDMQLIGALEHGLPNCSGVALGVDRLFMLSQQIKRIDKAIAFDISRA